MTIVPFPAINRLRTFVRVRFAIVWLVPDAIVRLMGHWFTAALVTVMLLNTPAVPGCTPTVLLDVGTAERVIVEVSALNVRFVPVVVDQTVPETPVSTPPALPIVMVRVAELLLLKNPTVKV